MNGWQWIPLDIKWYPITTTPTSTATASTANLAATTTTTAGHGGDSPERRVKVLGGKLGKGVVFISEAQTADLLNKMDKEAFDYYVGKLSSFILDKNARVKNHYETILKWWREDGGLEGDT